MSSARSRALLSLSLLLVALVAAGDWLLVTARGSQAPSWSHWWCSASGPLSGRHGSGPSTSLLAKTLDSLGALLPHWPHILPIVAALATLVYLRRANARYLTQAQTGP